MSNVDWVFAVWAGVATAFCIFYRNAVKGAHSMLQDVADNQIEIYRDDKNKLAWRKSNGIPK